MVKKFKFIYKNQNFKILEGENDKKKPKFYV